MGFFDIFKKKSQPAAAESDVQTIEQAEEQKAQEQQELNTGLERTKTGLFSKLARAVAG